MMMCALHAYTHVTLAKGISQCAAGQLGWFQIGRGRGQVSAGQEEGSAQTGLPQCPVWHMGAVGDRAGPSAVALGQAQPGLPQPPLAPGADSCILSPLPANIYNQDMTRHQGRRVLVFHVTQDPILTKMATTFTVIIKSSGEMEAVP